MAMSRMWNGAAELPDDDRHEPKRVPLTKRFPGQWVGRVKIWTPKRSSIGFEGWLDPTIAQVMLAAVVGELTDDDRAKLAALLGDIEARREPPADTSSATGSGL